MMKVLAWEPSIYRTELECRECESNIPPKSFFFIEEMEIKYLLPHEGPYEAYSVRCASCGLKESIQFEFNSLFRDEIGRYTPPEDIDTPLTSAIRKIVRQELQQILKEEAFDPHGPFSPAP